MHIGSQSTSIPPFRETPCRFGSEVNGKASGCPETVATVQVRDIEIGRIGRRTPWSIPIVIRRRTSWCITCVWREVAQ